MHYMKNFMLSVYSKCYSTFFCKEFDFYFNLVFINNKFTSLDKCKEPYIYKEMTFITFIPFRN